MKALVATAISLLLFGCASGGGTTSEVTQYLLRSSTSQPSGATTALTEVGIRSVKVAAYLDQPGVVVEIEPGQLRPAKYHEWAEMLPAGLKRYLRGEIATILGHDIDVNSARQPQWRLTVDIDIDEFHGTLSGTARINASWTLTNASGDMVGAYRFSETQQLTQSGYGGLVDAQTLLAARLGAAVGQSIRDAGQETAVGT